MRYSNIELISAIGHLNPGDEINLMGGRALIAKVDLEYKNGEPFNELYGIVIKLLTPMTMIELYGDALKAVCIMLLNEKQ